MNQIQTYTDEIKREVESEYGMGGLSDGLYGDYASEVAKRSLVKMYQELIEWNLGRIIEPPYDKDLSDADEKLNSCIRSTISYLKGRIEELKKDVCN